MLAIFSGVRGFMSLVDLWLKQREQLEDKQVSQVIAFAGDGKLKDGSNAASEFRAFLSVVPSTMLRKYGDQCLQKSFENSGFALQDVVNQVGRRLGFQVEDGRYHGVSGQIGFDGIWRFPDGHAVVVEVKTTDVYRIDLNTLADYRRDLVNQGKISKDQSSILVVVGREDTGDLEAQVRGSKHAWDVRLISVDALMRLMALKEEVEAPEIIERISAVLIPREFTRLDEIIDILFATTEDVKSEEPEVEEKDHGQNLETRTGDLLTACIKQIEHSKSISLIKRSRATFLTPDKSMALVCLVSKAYGKSNQQLFWYGLRRHQNDFLSQFGNGLIAFGCGNAKQILLIPASDFRPWLEEMNVTEKGNEFYWHVKIFQENGKLVLHRKKGTKHIELGKYLLHNF